MLIKIIKLITDYPCFYNFCQFVLEGDYYEIILKTIAPGKNEKILDIGCGTGYFTPFFNCKYFGIDFNKKYLRYAKKYQNDKRNFHLMDAKDIKFPDKSFDKSVIINFIHHLNDSDLERVLKEAKRLTKEKIFIFDMSTDRLNFFTSFFLYLDNGKFIRPVNRQLALIKSILKIEKSFTFKTPRNLLVHTAIICHP